MPKMPRRVWEVCEPHPDVFARDIDPSLFATSLHQVETGTADPDYTDPERFFVKTFMTRSLENVLEWVLARLMGMEGRGAPVLRLETPFGGGKTHSMIAMYHIARYPEAVEGTEAGEKLCERLELSHLPRNIKTVVLDGAALDVQGRDTDGFRIRTLWGELAYRLGSSRFYERIRSSDEARIPPGQAALAELLSESQPVLILMDEVLHYLAKAQAVRVGGSTLMEQSAAFLRELTAAVNSVPRTVLAVALPASSLEVAAGDIERAEHLFQHVRKVLGRTELIETPVAQDEVFGVLQRRLFRHIGTQRDARRAVDALTGYYGEYARFFPERLRSPSYRERLLAAYPFHPELVDLLYGRWGPHPQFQRTRGVLRLLALAIRRIWNHRPGSAFWVQPWCVDLADRHIRGEVVKLLDGGFDAVVTGDVVTRAGEIDRELGGDYYREELARGAATCALLYTISGVSDVQGATEEEIRVALLRPDLNPAQVSEVLGRLRQRLWFLRYRDQRYFFTARHNLNKIVSDYEREVPDDKVDETLSEYLDRVAGKGKTSLSVVVAPQDYRAVPDRPEATLVVLPLHLDDPEKAKAWMKEVVEKSGTGIRTNRNMLVFLAPERGHGAALRTATRRLIALRTIRQAALFRDLDAEDKREVQEGLREKEGEVQSLLLATYTRVYRPASEGVEELRVHFRRDLQTLAEAVQEALKEGGLLVDRLSPEYIADVLGAKERTVSISEIETVLTGAPKQPVFSRPREAIRQAVREGVQQGYFAVRTGEKLYHKEEVPEDVLGRQGLTLVPPGESMPSQEAAPTETTSLSLRVQTAARHIYPLRKVLEEIQNIEAQVTLEVVDETGQLVAKRASIETLLKEYGVTYSWRERPRDVS